MKLFDRLADGPKTQAELQRELNLADRPAAVLFTAMRAMDLLTPDAGGRLDLTPLSREHLLSGGPFEVSDYMAWPGKHPASSRCTGG